LPAPAEPIIGAASVHELLTSWRLQLQPTPAVASPVPAPT
jgi:hypothetical protein